MVVNLVRDCGYEDCHNGGMEEGLKLTPGWVVVVAGRDLNACMALAIYIDRRNE